VSNDVASLLLRNQGRTTGPDMSQRTSHLASSGTFRQLGAHVDPNRIWARCYGRAGTRTADVLVDHDADSHLRPTGPGAG
jgi:hypothetical protein